MRGGKKRQQGRRPFRSAGKRTSAGGRQPGLASQPALVLQAVLDSVDDALLLVDTGGRVEWANSRFRQWMGIEPQEWPGLASEERLVHRLAGQFRHPARFAASRRSWRGEQAVWDELELVKPTPRILERLVRPVFDGAGQAIGWLHVYRDITAGRLIHSKMLQTEKMAALGQLVSGIAHEINNPLTSILGYAQMARTQGAGAADGEESSAERIFQEAQRVQRIVRNLLVFARDARPERAPLQLNSVVERTLALRSYELQVKNVTVHLDLEADLPRILGDEHQLQQVVLNLVVNAEQAIESRASTANRRGNIAICTGRAGKNRVVLEVCDDGPGIPREVASRIFDPFFTTKPVGQGTGLGLSITYGIVREHAGEISVSDAPRSLAAPLQAAAQWRTSFLVELPMGPRSGAEPEPVRNTQHLAPAPAERRRRKPPHVLVVEDEQTVARLIRDVLQNDGMRVEVAIGGQAGLERLLAPAGTPSRSEFDLVICDLKMPGLDGASLYRELQGSNHPAKDRILFMTGDTLSRRTLEFIERYQKPFLPKPFLADELRAAVHRCLESEAGGPSVEPRRN